MSEVNIPGFEWSLVDNHEQVPQLIEEFGRDNTLAFDFETTGLHYIRDEIHGMGLANSSRAWYVFDSALPAIAPWLKDKMENPKVQTIAHSLKFDSHFLKKLDPSIKIANPFDTIIAQHLIDENETLKLKELAPRKLGLPDLDLPSFKDLQKSTKQEINDAAETKEEKIRRFRDVSIWQMDINRLGKYGALDAWLTAQIYPILYWGLTQEEMLDNFFQIEMPFVEVLLEMERSGMFLILDELYKLRKVWRAQLTRNLNKWAELTDGVNPASHPQVREYLYEKLGAPVTLTTKIAGNPSTSALAIQRLTHIEKTEEAANLLLKIRKYEKVLNTYVEPWIADMYEGHLYGSYNPTGTVTGRLASSNPNLQNIPAHGELGSQLRLCVGVPEGREMMVIDYSQVELRLVAAYAQVKSLMALFREGGDPHQLTADKVDIPRYIAKNLNFAWLYGAGPRKFCDMVEEKGYERPKEKQARSWFKQFSQAYPELDHFKDEVFRRGRNRGYVQTIWGRRRHLPDLNNPDNGLRSRAERQAVNAIIQGSAGDIIKYAMLQIQSFLPEYDAKMHGQIHDELLFSYPKEASEEFTNRVYEKMIEVEEVFNIPVPIVADYAVGDSWGACKHD